MSSRDIICQTLDYQFPERIARSFHDSDVTLIRYQLSSRVRDWQQIRPSYWERIDEWGNTWARYEDFSRGQVIQGVIEDISKQDEFEFPDYTQERAYQPVIEARADHPDKWLIGELPGFTCGVAWRLRGLENYLMDLLGEQASVQRLHDRIDALLVKMIDRYAGAGVDGVMIWEDWGIQDRLMIAPALWKKEFFPRFHRLCGLAHERGIKVVMHSCGQVGSIVPDLIAAGVDVLQFDQPELHGIDTLAAYQDLQPITFWCPVDIQTSLQTRDETIIRTRAREMMDKLWQGKGGLIAGYYDENESIGLEPRWQEYACDEFIIYGVQSNFAASSSKRD
jgi:hypothetical protein